MEQSNKWSSAAMDGLYLSNRRFHERLEVFRILNSLTGSNHMVQKEMALKMHHRNHRFYEKGHQNT